MPSRSAGLRHGTRRGQQALGLSRCLPPLHATLALPRRPLGVLPAVVQIATLAGCAPGEALALGRAVALALLGDEDAGDVLPPLEPLAKELLGGLRVPAALPRIARTRSLRRQRATRKGAGHGWASGLQQEALWPLVGRVDAAAAARHPAPTCATLGGGLHGGRRSRVRPAALVPRGSSEGSARRASPHG